MLRHMITHMKVLLMQLILRYGQKIIQQITIKTMSKIMLRRTIKHMKVLLMPTIQRFGLRHMIKITIKIM